MPLVTQLSDVTERLRILRKEVTYVYNEELEI